MNARDRVKVLVDNVQPLDRALLSQVQAHLDSLTKPQGALGRLEDVAMQFALIRGEVRPALGGRAIVTFAADHGVTVEGVSAYPREVTSQMVLNMLAGGAAINQLCRRVDARLLVVDIGVDDDLESADSSLRRHKVRRGTRNMVDEPAMTLDETAEAIEVGVALAREVVDDGAVLVGTGEMGIGNTTPAAALLAALLPCSARDVTGRGTGIDDATLDHKVSVIERALNRHVKLLADPFEALAAVGGLEIAGITGLILGAASRRAGVVIDGFISSAAALVAIRLCEQVRGFLFFSHRSAEAGHAQFFDSLGEAPLLDLGMRLGEGTGGALAMGIIEAAVATCNDMATFSSAAVSELEEG